MASTSRRADVALDQELFEEPWRFDPFQAVRILERLGGDRVPVGHDGPPGREALRFSSRLSLASPPSPLFDLKAPADGQQPPVLTVAHIGLVGTLGVLPRVYTEVLLEWLRDSKDRSVVDFLDLFQHRMISLFHRAWEKYNAPRTWERERESGASRREEPFSGPIFALIGLGFPSLRGRLDGIPDDTLARHASAFARKHRSPFGLGRMIREHFGLPAEVISFVGRWLRLDPSEVSTLSGRSAANSLGRGLVLGERVWDIQSKFRVRLGPLSRGEIEALAPGTPGHRALADLVRFYAGPDLDFDIQLVLKAEDVPTCRLAKGGDGARLGRSGWLLSGPSAVDRDDAVYPARA